MKGYGNAKNDEDSLLELATISLVAKPGELRDIANFLAKCADEIEADPEGWEHEHLMDSCSGYDDCVDFVVSSEDS